MRASERDILVCDFVRYWNCKFDRFFVYCLQWLQVLLHLQSWVCHLWYHFGTWSCSKRDGGGWVQISQAAMSWRDKSHHAFRWGREMQSRFSFDRVRLPTIGTQALPGRRHPIFAILWPNDHPKVCICIPNSSPQKFLRWVPNLYESVSPCPVTLQICCRHASSFSTRRTSSAGGSYVAFDIVWKLPVAHAFGMPTHADSSCSGCDVVRFGVVKWKSRQVAYRLRRSTVQEVNY